MSFGCFPHFARMVGWKLFLYFVFAGHTVYCSSSPTTYSTQTPAICNTAVQSFGNNTVLRSNPEYEALRTINWSKTAQLYPGCIIEVLTAEELSCALKLVSASNTTFAVRSGGHEVEPGFGNIDGGVLIDLANLNEITINSREKNVVVGTGNRWPAVYQALDPHNLTVVGGRANNPGVGGFILGGGLSYLSNKFGLACDNVENFEVVLANGTITNANPRHNSDLFWALKGGLNNFGIVTRFTLTTFPQGNIWGGTLAFAPNQTSQVLKALAEYERNGESDVDSNVFVQVAPINATLGTGVTLFYARPMVERPSVFSPFYQIPSLLDTTMIQNMTAFVSSSDVGPLIAAAPRATWRSTTFTTDEQMYLDAYALSVSGTQELRNITAGTVAISFQPIHPNLVTQGEMKGGNPLGLRKSRQNWYSLGTAWLFANSDIRARNISQTALIAVEEKARSRGLSHRYRFLNDAAKEQDVMRYYGEDNLRRLRRVAKHFDPSGFFQKQQPGGFKLDF